MTNAFSWPPVFQGEVLPEPDPDAPLLPDAELPAHDREVHDWDGATRTVTTYVRCPVDDHHVWGAGVGHDQDEARRRALSSVRARLLVSS
jgi:hypothetical protein